MRWLSTLAACALATAVTGGAAAQEKEGEAAPAEREQPGEEASLQDTAEQPGEETSVQGAGAPPTGGPARRGRTVWWNEREIVEALSLSEEQRKKMDGRIDAWRQANREESPATFASFNEALSLGNWDKARSELEQLSKQTSEPLRARGELKIDLLSTLSDEQLAILVERYPRVIYQPLLPTRRRGRP